MFSNILYSTFESIETDVRCVFKNLSYHYLSIYRQWSPTEHLNAKRTFRVKRKKKFKWFVNADGMVNRKYGFN